MIIFPYQNKKISIYLFIFKTGTFQYVADDSAVKPAVKSLSSVLTAKNAVVAKISVGPTVALSGTFYWNLIIFIFLLI